MPKIFFLSIIGYIATLAVAQTTYGGPFMNLRWIMLGASFLIGGAWWSRRKKEKITKPNVRAIVVAYLALTFLSIIFAENPNFSFFRWGSHAMMLVTLMIFMRESMTSEDAQILLLTLKAMISVVLLASVLNPASLGRFDNPNLFRGIAGSPNTMGHNAAIGFIIFFHGYLTERKKWLKMVQGGMLILAAMVLWNSGARSSMIFFLTGFLITRYIYRDMIKKRLFFIILLCGLLAFTLPDLPGKIKQFIVKREKTGTNISESLFETRVNLWQDSWESFIERPLFGWGFATYKGIPQTWKFELHALGFTSKDNVNDTLTILAGTGIVGFIGYVLLIYMVISQMPDPKRRLSLEKKEVEIYDAQAIFCITSISMLVLFQLDDTAFSGGNFVSATMWICAASAAALRKELLIKSKKI